MKEMYYPQRFILYTMAWAGMMLLGLPINTSCAETPATNTAVPALQFEPPPPTTAPAPPMIRHRPSTSGNAPDFQFKDQNGASHFLSDFHGKYILLDFWTEWCRPSREQIPYLKAVYNAFGKRDDFIIISINLDNDTQKAKDFVKKNDMQWMQSYSGDWSEKVDAAQQYAIEFIPAMWLINPKGKIVASELRDEILPIAVAGFLKEPIPVVVQIPSTAPAATQDQ